MSEIILVIFFPQHGVKKLELDNSNCEFKPFSSFQHLLLSKRRQHHNFCRLIMSKNQQKFQYVVSVLNVQQQQLLLYTQQKEKTENCGLARHTHRTLSAQPLYKGSFD